MRNEITNPRKMTGYDLYNRQEAGLSPFGREDLKQPSEGSDIGQEKVLLSATAERKELMVRRRGIERLYIERRKSLYNGR